MINVSAGLGNLFVVVFGLLVGSFLNVLIVRLPQKKNIAWPPSHCPACESTIQWWDNFPVLSFLILRGKCRSCRCVISVRYPVVELLTALLFLAAKLRFGLSVELLLRDFPFLAILIAVTFIDLEHRIIPDSLSLGGLGWGLGTALVFSFLAVGPAGASIGWLSALAGAAIGFGLFYGLAWGYYRITGRSGLGGGDIKLLAMLGANLGVAGVFSCILISSIFGSVVGISWALLQKKRQSLMQVSIPYGPFMVVGGLYHYFLSDILWFQFMTPM